MYSFWRQTDGRTDGQAQRMRYRERRLNNNARTSRLK